MPDALVQRFDLARFSPRTSKTPQGFLKAPAYFTRSGIFEYTRADGTKVRELRPEDEVFRKDSLTTISSAPLTLGHPREGMVNPTNAKKLTIGVAGEKVERKDSLVEGSVIVMDSKAINDIHAGKLRDISMGYTCSIERTAGVDPIHGRYDQIQRNIRYNHVAMGGQSWGRAGDSVGIRLDSLEGADDTAAVQRFDGFTQLEMLVAQKMDLMGLNRDELAKKAGIELFKLEDILWGFLAPKKSDLKKLASAIGVEVETLISLVPRVDRADSSPRKDSTMDEEIIKIGGVEFKVPKNAAQALNAEIVRKDSRIEELKTENEKLQGRFDAQGEELTSAKGKLEELQDPKRFDSVVQERLDLLNKARSVLGGKAEISGSKREIMEQVLKHDKADLDLSDKSDDYVEARFDARMEQPAPRQSRADSSKANVRTAVQVAKNGGAEDRYDSKAARERMLQANRDAWKTTNAEQLRG